MRFHIVEVAISLLSLHHFSLSVHPHAMHCGYCQPGVMQHLQLVTLHDRHLLQTRWERMR